MNPAEDLRVLVLRENWLGCTGWSAFNAFARAAAGMGSISEGDYVPNDWQSFPMRVVGRLTRSRAVREFNRALLREAEVLKPHLLFAVKGTYVQAETLRMLRRMGTTLYCFYPDTSLTAYGPYLPSALPEYDWIFTTKSFGPADLKNKLGIENTSFLPHAYDPDVHRPRPVNPETAATFGADVSFVGNYSPRKSGILEALVRHRPGLDLKVWGPGWERLPARSPLRPHAAFRRAIGTAYATAICCSKINLALLIEAQPGAPFGDRITSRTFHIPACGGLMLHERTDELLEIFREDESCVCFEGVEELAAKIAELLADDAKRERIAKRGREVVTRAHSWDDRIRTILDHYRKAGGERGRQEQELIGAGRRV